MYRYELLFHCLTRKVHAKNTEKSVKSTCRDALKHLEQDIGVALPPQPDKYGNYYLPGQSEIDHHSALRNRQQEITDAHAVYLQYDRQEQAPSKEHLDPNYTTGIDGSCQQEGLVRSPPKQEQAAGRQNWNESKKRGEDELKSQLQSQKKADEKNKQNRENSSEPSLEGPSDVSILRNRGV